MSSNIRAFPAIRGHDSQLYAQEFSASEISDIRERHSLFPLFRPTSQEGDEQVLDFYLRANEDDFKRNPFTSWANNVNSIGMYRCKDCFQEMVEGSGFTWLRREWMIPHISHCFKHQSRLLNARGCNCHNWRYGIFSGQCEWCGYSIWNDNASKKSTPKKIEKWSVSVLKSSPPRIDPRHRSLVFREVYKRLYSDRTPSSAKIIEELTALVSEHVVERRYTFNQVHCSDTIESILTRGVVSPSSVDVFWIPISQAFESFSDFLKFVRGL